MNESTAAALRIQADIQAALISDMEAGISDLQALRAATADQLDQVAAKTPNDLSTQVRLRGELLGADQMLQERSDALTAARLELERLQGQEDRADKLERIADISRQMEAEQQAIRDELQEIAELLKKHLPKTIDMGRREKLNQLRSEWHSLLRDISGANVQLLSGVDDNQKLETVLQSVEALGGNTNLLRATANYQTPLVPLRDESEPREKMVNEVWIQWQAEKKNPYDFMPYVEMPKSEMMLRLEADALPSVPNFARPLNK